MMDPQKMGKQMIEFYKSTFDNSFSAMMMLQEQMERLTNMYWGQMVNVPDEIKQGVAEWTKSYKKNCEDFKKTIDESFKKLESFVTEAEKPEKMAKSA
jgi:hypothetical protein